MSRRVGSPKAEAIAVTAAEKSLELSSLLGAEAVAGSRVGFAEVTQVFYLPP